jgi:hypothetical protein
MLKRSLSSGGRSQRCRLLPSEELKTKKEKEKTEKGTKRKGDQEREDKRRTPRRTPFLFQC